MEKFDRKNYECLKVTEKEKSAIQRYMSFNHTNMNILLNLEASVIDKLNSKGWYIDLTPENINRNLENLQEIYSAMYKNSKKNPIKTSTYRGTRNEEIEKSSMGNRFLSTSIDENIAMRFTQYNNGAIINIRKEANVPYLVMDNFLDETQASEEEILISPFCRVKNLQEYYSNSNVKNYRVNLEKGEFLEITEEEEKEYEKIIYNFDFTSKIEEYKDLHEQSDMLYIRIRNNKYNLKDFNIIREEQEKVEEELFKLLKEFGEVKKALIKYMQGKFRKIEEKIDKEIEIEDRARKELKRRENIQNYKNKKEKLLKKADDLINQIEKRKNEYFLEDEEEKEITNISKNLCIDVERDDDFYNLFEKIKKKIENKREEIEKIQIPDNLTKEEELKLEEELGNIYFQIDNIQVLLNEVRNVISRTKKMEKEKLEQKIVNKVDKKLLEKAKETFQIKKHEISSEKNTFFDKIFGKAKIRQAQIENYELRIEVIKNGCMSVPENLNALQTYIYTYSEKMGCENLPEEAKIVLGNMKKSVIRNFIPVADIVVFNSNMPIPEGKKLTRKEILKNIEKQNNILRSKKQNMKKDDNKKKESFNQGILVDSDHLELKNMLNTTLNSIKASNVDIQKDTSEKEK